MEISDVRRRLQGAMRQAGERTRARRERADAAARDYDTFLKDVATPIVRQLVGALKAENLAFTAFTPRGGLRLALDRGRDDYVEFELDASGDPPQVIGRVSRTRGSRTLTEERPVKPGVGPGALTEEDTLAFLLDAIGPWLER